MNLAESLLCSFFVLCQSVLTEHMASTAVGLAVSGVGKYVTRKQDCAPVHLAGKGPPVMKVGIFSCSYYVYGLIIYL